jgi:putative transposase
MPRPLRVDFPGAVHHVTARGVDGRTIFVDDADHHVFVRMLGRVAERNHWTRLAHCLMDNHYHLLVTTPMADLAGGMKRLNGEYAQEFNRRHRRRGHLFQDRYWSRLVRSDEQLTATATYIAMNPVAAGLCAEPGDWAWSSAQDALSELLADYQR